MLMKIRGFKMLISDYQFYINLIKIIKMSEKDLIQIDSFYTSSIISQAILDQPGFKGVKNLGFNEGLQIIGIKKDKNLWDILKFDLENKALTKWKFQEPI